MPDPSSSPVVPLRFQRAAARLPLEAAWASGAGVAAIAALAAAGAASPAPAAAAALLVGGFGIWMTRRALAKESPPGAVRDEGARPPAANAYGAQPPFETVFESLAEPLLIVSGREPDDLIARRVAWANAASRDLLRIPREGALLASALRHPEALEAVEESLFGAVPRTVEYETGGAQPRTWRVMSAPLVVQPDGTRWAAVLLRDETEARRSQRMSADFLANASHELRTPLASLSGFIETLRGHARDDVEAREKFLAIMAGQAARMGRLVSDLLSLSRIEMNEHVPPVGAADLALAVRDVLDGLGPLAKAREVAVEFVSPPSARVVGERDQLVQVALNLVDNAIKYAPKGSVVRVELANHMTAEQALDYGRRPGAARLSLLTPDRADRRYVLLRVSDRGPGIGREHLPRLTERFYRVEGQKSGERSGTGLGLAIVKHVINRHRGGLAVESLIGEGTTFSVYLPEAD